MAVGTAVSRLTGFARTVVLVAAIGLGLVGDAYNTANTLPNIVYELLLGGVLTSVIVPLLVHARARDADDGLAYTQRLLSLLTVVLLVATALAILLAPVLTYAYGIRDDPEQVALANMLARILLVEIVFYGVGAMLTAILNSRQVFGPPAWAPVLNNLVVIATGLVFIGLNDAGDLTTTTISPGLVWLLGIGTTLGIVVQALALLPSLRRAGVRWAWRWDWRNAGLGEAGRLGLWVIGYVAVSQVGYVVIMALANEAGRASGVGSIVYANASLLFQLPYGIIGVALLTALLPRMSRAAAGADRVAVVRDLSLGARLTAVALIPISALLIVLGPAIATVAFARGQVDAAQARTVGVVLAASAFGLFPYAVTMLQLRVFYALKDARTPTLINMAMVAVRVPLCLLVPALVPTEHIVTGLAIANSVSFVVGAVVGELWLRRRMGRLETPRVLRTAGLLALASTVGALAAWAVVIQIESLLGRDVLGSAAAVVAGSLIGGVAVLAGCLVLPIPEVRDFAAVVRRRFGGSSPDRPDGAARAAEQSVRSAGGFGEGRGEKASQVESGRPAEAAAGPGGGLDESASGEPVTIGGRYRLLSRSGADEETGAGRLSTWRARDNLLLRDVMLRIHAPGGSAARPFLDRALGAGVLSHPALAMVYDAVDENRRAYVVSEWVEGISLAAKLGSGPLPEPDARETIRRVAEGVAQAHDLGLAVGGLTPDRVILTRTGSVTVVAIPAPVASSDADVRALGALLFATLTGFLPVEDDRAALDRQLQNAAAPDLAEVALAALDGRLPTAGEMVSRLLAGRRRHEHGFADSGLAFITDRYEYDTDGRGGPQVDAGWPTVSEPGHSGPEQSGPGQSGPGRSGAERSGAPPDDDYPTDNTRPIAAGRETESSSASESASSSAPVRPGDEGTAGNRPPRSWLTALPLRGSRRRQAAEAQVDEPTEQPAEEHASPRRPAEQSAGEHAGAESNNTANDAGSDDPDVTRAIRTTDVAAAATSARPAARPTGTAGTAGRPTRTSTDPPTDPVAARPPPAGAGRATDTTPAAAGPTPGGSSRATDTVAVPLSQPPSGPPPGALPPGAGGTPAAAALAATGPVAPTEDADEDADEPPEWLLRNRTYYEYDDGSDRRRRTWLVLAFPVAALLAVVIIGWVIGSSFDDATRIPAGQPSTTAQTGSATTPAPSTTPETTPEQTPAPLDVDSATVYDPFGDGEPENNDDSPLAFDGDPASSWPTLTYRGSPLLGNLKPGVGLVFDLGAESVVSEVTIVTGQPGATVELRAGSQPAGDLETFPVVGQAELSDQTVIPVDSEQPARYWLVWITELVPDEGDFSASLGEVAFVGVPAG
ncbi:MAG: murein biosynthesis integral membrane protein MurJ [Geodermatophilaceae bacterium]|nr:murein biosynthesis integral membrane protein MurJ [Geodermatophilaceae bacterium]